MDATLLSTHNALLVLKVCGQARHHHRRGPPALGLHRVGGLLVALRLLLVQAEVLLNLLIVLGRGVRGGFSSKTHYRGCHITITRSVANGN